MCVARDRYRGDPAAAMEVLPPLLNSVKMIHTIARFFSSRERMTGLLCRLTNQLITCCKVGAQVARFDVM